MSFNKQSQQNQMRRQQEQFRHQQQLAAAAEEEKKRKRRNREAQMLQSGGINISDVDNLDVRGDMVGRDKVHQINANYQRDEKSSCFLLFERAVMFTWIFVGMLSMTVLFAGILSGGASSSPLMIMIILIGGTFALIIAFWHTVNVSSHRE